MLFASFAACDSSQSKQTELARKRRREKNEARNKAVIQKNEQIDMQLLMKMVENEKAQCPKDVGGGMVVEDVELKDTAMIIYCECKNHNMMKALDSGLKDDVRNSIVLSICQNENDLKRIKLLRKTNTSIVYLFINDSRNQSHEMIITPDEMPDSIPSEKTVNDFTRKMFVNNLNVDLPQQMNQAMVQQKASVEADNIVLHIICDEDFVDMDRLKASVKESKKNMLEAMKNDPEGLAFIKAVQGIQCNVIYRYRGNKSNKIVDIVIYNKEMN